MTLHSVDFLLYVLFNMNLQVHLAIFVFSHQNFIMICQFSQQARKLNLCRYLSIKNFLANFDFVSINFFSYFPIAFEYFPIVFEYLLMVFEYSLVVFEYYHTVFEYFIISYFIKSFFIIKYFYLKI